MNKKIKALTKKAKALRAKGLTYAQIGKEIGKSTPVARAYCLRGERPQGPTLVGSIETMIEGLGLIHRDLSMVRDFLKSIH